MKHGQTPQSPCLARARRIAAALVCGVSLVAASACSPSPEPPAVSGSAPVASAASFPKTVKDASGHELTLERPPARVCFLSGTPLNMWYDLGNEAACATEVTGNLKMRPEYAERMRHVPSVGPMYQVNIEKLTGYNPDLVITMDNFQTETVERVKALGFPVFTTRAKTMEDVVETYRALGEISGRSDVASTKTTQITTQVDSVVARMPARKDTVVILYVTSGSLAVKLENSIAGDIVKRLGITNVAAGQVPASAGSENTPLDIEAIVKANPDYVLVTSMIESNDEARAVIAKQFQQNAAWQAVDAVKNNRVIMLPQQYFLFNAGPYYPEAVTYVAASLHPDVFGAPVEP